MGNRFPREDWIDQGTNDLMERAEENRKKGLDADQSGDYVVSSKLYALGRPIILFHHRISRYLSHISHSQARGTSCARRTSSKQLVFMFHCYR